MAGDGTTEGVRHPPVDLPASEVLGAKHDIVSGLNSATRRRLRGLDTPNRRVSGANCQVNHVPRQVLGHFPPRIGVDLSGEKSSGRVNPIASWGLTSL